MHLLQEPEAPALAHTPMDSTDIPNNLVHGMNPPTQQQPQPFMSLIAQQIAAQYPDIKAKYELLPTDWQEAAMTQPGSRAGNNIYRLKMIAHQESKAFARKKMPDIPMTLEIRAETAAKLQEAVCNMDKISRAFGTWYHITHNNARARMFFKSVNDRYLGRQLG